MKDLNKIIIAWAIILFPAFSMAEETINTSDYGSQVENSTSNVSETGASQSTDDCLYYVGWSKYFNEATLRYEYTDKDNMWKCNIKWPWINANSEKKVRDEFKQDFKETKDNFEENRDNFKKQVKEIKSDMMDRVKDFKETKQELKIKYKKQFAKKLAWKLDSLTDDKIKAIIAKIDVAIEKYSTNERLTPEKKEKFIAQLNAIKDLLQEKLDELINLDELIWQ